MGISRHQTLPVSMLFNCFALNESASLYLDAHCTTTYPGMSAQFDGVPELDGTRSPNLRCLFSSAQTSLRFSDEKPLIDLESDLRFPFRFWESSSTAGVGELGLRVSSEPETDLQEEVGNLETQQRAFVPIAVSTYSLAHI